MTLTNSRDRFQVWLSDDQGTTWQRSNRIKINSFRRQEKALGSLSGAILKWDGTNDEWELEPNSLLRERNYIKVIDSYLTGNKDNPDINPNGGANNNQYCVFFGYLVNVKTDIFKEEQRQSIGTITANEIGWLFNETTVFKYFNVDGKQDFNPPDFNPKINGKYYGNRSGSNTFENEADNFVVSENGEWPAGYSVSRVWALEDVITVVVNSFPIAIQLDIADQGGSVPPIFQDTDIPRTYPSFNNRPISEALSDLIQDPLYWTLSYRDPNPAIIKLKIGMKINATLPDHPDPSPQDITFDEREINLNFMDTETRVERVTLKGGPIVVCGGFCPWVQNNAQNIEDNWDLTDFTLWKNGANAGQTISAEIGDKFRANPRFDDIVQNFRLIQTNDVNGEKIYTTPSFGVGDVNVSSTDVSFFPNFVIQNPDGSINEIPPVEKDPTQSNNHQTPSPLNIKWLDKLPIYKNDGNDLLDPLCIVPTLDPDGNLFYLDSIAANNFQNKIKNQIEFVGENIKLKISPLQSVYLWNEEDLFEGGDTSQQAASNFVGAGRSNYDPDVGVNLPLEGSKSHWARLIFIGAAETNQRLEMSITESGVTDPQGEIVIEDDSYSLWYVHNDVPFAFVINDDGTGSLSRLAGGYTRNDVAAAKSVLEKTWEYAKIDKKSIEIERAMDSTFEFPGLSGGIEYDIGDIIGTITDGAEIYDVNTMISSIEYVIDDEPSVSFVTQIPKIGFNKRVETGVGSAVRSSVNYSNSRNYGANTPNTENKENPIETVRVGDSSYSQAILPINSMADVSGAPTDGQVLTWNDLNNSWEPQDSSGGGSDPVSGSNSFVLVNPPTPSGSWSVNEVCRILGYDSVNETYNSEECNNLGGLRPDGIVVEVDVPGYPAGTAKVITHGGTERNVDGSNPDEWWAPRYSSPFFIKEQISLNSDSEKFIPRWLLGKGGPSVSQFDVVAAADVVRPITGGFTTSSGGSSSFLSFIGMGTGIFEMDIGTQQTNGFTCKIILEFDGQNYNYVSKTNGATTAREPGNAVNRGTGVGSFSFSTPTVFATTSGSSNLRIDVSGTFTNTYHEVSFSYVYGSATGTLFTEYLLKRVN